MSNKIYGSLLKNDPDVLKQSRQQNWQISLKNLMGEKPGPYI